MSKRKPNLSELSWLANTGGDGGSRFTGAVHELRAAEAVIRIARDISDGKIWYPDQLAAALARLNRVTVAKGGKR